MRTINWTMNREDWLTRAAGTIANWYRANGFDAKDVLASCGWPVADPHHCAAEIWTPDQSPDGHWHVFVNPMLFDSIVVLGALAHEVAHTIKPSVGHRGIFARAVRAIGLVGATTSIDTLVGPRFHPLADDIIHTLGQYPYKGLRI